ncbi:hypothetical protein [Nocardia caishijiensis]|uniref:PE family protein n=1 Tax=Nocardia caishijiensis TaxID=184756 RepID=A0ABQ6YJ05_9NOCA|nr:hypothetical protein [Nocardia caishijiensis]KAF0845773.1 hypothetical protein FNL39_106162 [Nocardia caishijiensis]
MLLSIDPNEWNQLLAQAESGQLSLDPEIGKGLDQACDYHLDRLEEIYAQVDQIRNITGFGSFNSSQTLERKFSMTASGGDRPLDEVLKKHIEVVQTAKEVVAKAIANFVAQDQAAGDQISATGEHL